VPAPDQPLAGLFDEARRQLAVCNSCRYCAGYCPVWPELELRTVLREGDLGYLANLCHDCQDCFTACMYTAPHEFDLNPPQIFARLREQSYVEYAWPRLPRRLAGAPGAALALATTAVLLCLLGYLSTGRLLPAAPQPGSPYAILPHALLVLVAAVPALYCVAVLAAGGVRFWRASGGRPGDLLRPRLWAATLAQAATLRHMRGGGAGCDYPGDEPGPARRRWHLVTVAGFALCAVSTASAAVAEELLGRLPPYPYLSVPVLTGTAGGLALLAGGTGLLVLKGRSDPGRGSPAMRRGDYGLLWALLVLAATGLLTLLLRGHPAFGPVFLAHLSAVVVAFGIAPYTKFAHGVYRLLAIHKHNADAQRAARAG
jgi:citrate/tricarballylate utilization protein